MHVYNTPVSSNLMYVSSSTITSTTTPCQVHRTEKPINFGELLKALNPALFVAEIILYRLKNRTPSQLRVPLAHAVFEIFGAMVGSTIYVPALTHLLQFYRQLLLRTWQRD